MERWKVKYTCIRGKKAKTATTTRKSALLIYQNFVEHIILRLPKSVFAVEMKVVEFKMKADRPQ